MTRESFNKVYLDWVNNYLTIEKFAEHYGLHINEAENLINLSKTIFENNHPES
jgi:endo-alpha-1,4-polygalactosaminidase (GH114 family)